MRRAPVLFTTLCMLGLTGTGCSTYYDETNSATLFQHRKTITFDDRLPSAMENVFDDCHDPITFDPTTSLAPLGSCEGQPLTDYGGVEEQVLAIALASQGDIDLGGSFPGGIDAALNDIHKFEDVLPWPLQNCEIFIELDLDLHGLALTDLDARWLNHSGTPSLRVDFDRDTSQPFISGEIEGDVDCPSAINEPVVQPHLPDDNYTINLTGVDLDIWFEFEVVDGQIETSVDSDVDIGGISISPAFSPMVTDNVGSIEDILEDSTGMALADLTADIEDAINDEMSGLAGSLDDAINDELDDGYTAQSVEIDGGELKIVATKPRTLTPKPKPFFP